MVRARTSLFRAMVRAHTSLFRAIAMVCSGYIYIYERTNVPLSSARTPTSFIHPLFITLIHVGSYFRINLIGASNAINYGN